MHPLNIAALSIRGFRNLRRVDVSFGPRFNVIGGDNGQGKTNLLEALYVVATSKSFRTSKMGELLGYEAADVVEHGPSALASIRAKVQEDASSRVQSVGLKAGSRMVKIDDKRPPSLAAYAVRTPVVVFHPGEIVLSMGASAERRRLLDRTALYVAPASMGELEAYTRALKSRQRVLETKGSLARELDEWEALVVKHGLEVMVHRQRASELLAEHAQTAFSTIAAAGLSLLAHYAPTAPREVEDYRQALVARRTTDLRRGSATMGPHRDELSLLLRVDDAPPRPARGFASQGQHRAITLSLKSAELEVIGRARGVRPVLLLDDVSSELDRARTSALFSFLREQEGQVFLTTTRPELIDTGEDRSARRDFRIEGGELHGD